MRNLIILLLLPLSLFAKDKEVVIGVNVEPPFVMREGGKYTGLSIDLFEHYAKTNGINDFSYKFYSTTNDLIDAVSDGEAAIGVSSITITSERCEKVGFSQPYFTSSISLAYNKDQESSWTFIKSFFSFKTFTYLIYLFIFFFIIGTVFWYIERKHNPEFFREDWMGVWDGFYYAVIVFTTIGFGDKYPKTRIGKAATVVYGLICMGTAALFIGNISSSITLDKLESEVNIENLNKKKVGTVKGTFVTNFLDKKEVRYINYNDVEEGLRAIKSGELEVFVYDTPTLQYLIDKENLSSIISLSNETYEPQYYGFIHDKKSDIDETLNPTIIDYISGDKWNHILYQYKLENR